MKGLKGFEDCRLNIEGRMNEQELKKLANEFAQRSVNLALEIIERQAARD